MADRREILEAAMNEVETQEVEHEEVQEEIPQDEPARNEKGQFVAEDEAVAEETSIEATSEDADDPEQPEEQPEISDIPKPTTWKKDLLPLWDKIAKGEVLTKDESKNTLEYLNQRENEFKKGVSVYKAGSGTSQGFRRSN